MRQVTETFNVFKFSELDEKVQSKWLNKNRDFNTADSDWAELTLEDYQRQLDEIGFEGAKISFSGFCSQGDGASFTAERLDIPKLLKKIEETCDNTRKFTRYIPELVKQGAILLSIRTNNYHYSHEHTKTVELEDSIPERLYRLGLLASDFRDAVEGLRLDLCKDFYNGLSNEYHYLTSDDAIKEVVEINEYEFLENGEIYK